VSHSLQVFKGDVLELPQTHVRCNRKLPAGLVIGGRFSKMRPDRIISPSKLLHLSQICDRLPLTEQFLHFFKQFLQSNYLQKLQLFLLILLEGQGENLCSLEKFYNSHKQEFHVSHEFHAVPQTLPRIARPRLKECGQVIYLPVRLISDRIDMRSVDKEAFPPKFFLIRCMHL
jgi:hypothetical protein